MIRSPDCHLPALPDPIDPPVGFPTSSDILIDKTDFAAMLAYVAGLRDWIDAANACLQAGQR